MLDLPAFPKEVWYFSAESRRPELHSKKIGLKKYSVKRNKGQLQGMVALMTGSIFVCVCVCTYAWCESYGMAKLVHMYPFPMFIHLSLCHSESYSVMHPEIWFLQQVGPGIQACSFAVPCQTWDSPARQVVLKTGLFIEEAQLQSQGHPKIGKTFRWEGSFQIPRNFHQPQCRGCRSRWNHGFP